MLYEKLTIHLLNLLKNFNRSKLIKERFEISRHHRNHECLGFRYTFAKWHYNKQYDFNGYNKQKDVNGKAWRCCRR